MSPILLCLIFGALLLVSVYSPTFLSCYAFSDDFGYLTPDLPLSFFQQLQCADGRPLFAAMLAAFRFTPQICDLYLVRLLGLFGAWCFFLSVLWVFCRQGLAMFLAAVIGLGIAFSPPFITFVGWASLYSYTYGSAFGILAGGAAHEVFESRGSQSQRCVWSILSCTLLFVALLIYQPAASFFWVGVAPMLLFRGESARRKAARFIRLMLHFGSTLIVYYALYKFTIWPFTESVSERGTGLVSDVGERLYQFYLWALRDSFSLFSLEQRIWLILSTAAVCLFGIRLSGGYAALSAFPALIALTSYATLIAGPLSLNFRTQGALHALIVTTFVLGLERILSRVKGVAAWIAPLALLAVCAIGSNTFLQLRERLIIPSVAETSAISEELDEYLDSCPDTLLISPPTYTDAIAPVRYDEFGHPNTLISWGQKHTLKVLLSEKFGPCSPEIVPRPPAGTRRERRREGLIDIGRAMRRVAGQESGKPRLPSMAADGAVWR